MPVPQEIPGSVEQALAGAIAHHEAGRPAEAERLYRAVIDAAPQHLAALYRLGVLYLQNERAPQALPYLEQALRLQPRNPAILNSLGVASQTVGRDTQAVAYFRQALAIDPADAGTLANLGRALREQGDFRAARECYAQLVAADPSRFDACLEAGKCEFEMGNFSEALLHFEKVLSQRPDDADALGAAASALWALGRNAEARAKLERAVRTEPDNAKALLNFGEFLAFDEGKIDEALGYFDRALRLAPAYNNALWRKSFVLLARGEYREGWTLYAACLGGRETRGLNKFAPRPPWDGSPAPGKRLLIWCEQGLGDSLHFIRFAAACRARVGRVSVFCQKPLVRLFKALPFIDDASDICDSGSFDLHVPIMNLPHIFDTRLETIPGEPYLSVDPAAAAEWAARLADMAGADILKVGLVWAGGAHKENVIASLTDRQRSIDLARMKGWFDVPGVKFFSLQMDEAAAQIPACGLADRLTDFMGEIGDFADTAALVQNLDLVITVDTSVAHLAGGLGKPVWILSRYNADWRWLQNRSSSPWYPSARVFGQPTMGDWDSVLAEVEAALRRYRRFP